MAWWWYVSLTVLMQVWHVEGAVAPVYCSDHTYGGSNTPHAPYGLPCATYDWTIKPASGATVTVKAAYSTGKRNAFGCVTNFVGDGSSLRKGPWCLISGTQCTDNVNDKSATCNWGYCPALTVTGRRCVWGGTYNSAKIYSCQQSPIVSSKFFCPLDLIYSVSNVDECVSAESTLVGLPMAACPIGCSSGNCAPAFTCTAATSGGKGTCVFPFKFNGHYHGQCIQGRKSTKYWCGTTQDVDADSSKWAECNAAGTEAQTLTEPDTSATAATPPLPYIPGMTIPTTKGTAGGTCQAKWKYKPTGAAAAVEFTGCHTGIDPRGPICGITTAEVKLATAATWGFCTLPNIVCAKAADWDTKYPCDVLVDNKPTGVAVADQTKVIATVTKCVFPFKYTINKKERDYYYCTTAGHNTVAKAKYPPWCGIQAVVGTVNTQWSYCKLETSQCAPGSGCQKFTTTGALCVFPFSYTSAPNTVVQAHSCITNNYPTAGTTSKAWCGTQTTAATTPSATWGDCNPTEVCPDIATEGTTPTCPVLTWISIPSQGAAEPNYCKFPFKFNNKIYNSCTKAGAVGYWCAHTNNYDQDKLWGDCLIPTYGGNSQGQYCHFPFSYTDANGNTQQYYDCTTTPLPKNANGGAEWCATSQFHDKDKKWGLCATNFCLTSEQKKPPCTVKALSAGVTVTCKDSFVYPAAGQPGSANQYPCILAGGIVPWCEVTDTTIKNANCIKPTHGGTGDNSHCYFPFTYKTIRYYTCIKTLDKPEGAWCGITSDYDNDKKWGYCAMDWCTVPTATNPNCPIQTTGGNANGANCTFPFTYQGSTYTGCSTQNYPVQHGNDHPVTWCCTTANCDGANPVFGHCTQPTEGGTGLNAPCVFPFIAKVSQTVQGVTSIVDKSFYTCQDGTQNIANINFKDLPTSVTWCSTTTNLATDGKWGVCKTDWCAAPALKAPPCTIFTTDGRKCVFPFTVSTVGKQYGACTLENYPGVKGEGEGPVYWCATQTTFVSTAASGWGRCVMPTTGGNSLDKPCVFPFWYQAKWHYKCIKDSSSTVSTDTNGWCSTTRNFDRWNKYGICSPNFCRSSPKKKKVPTATLR